MPLLRRIAVWIAAIVAPSFFLISRAPTYGNGNGLFVLAGFALFTPICRLAGESLLRVLEIICTSWVFPVLWFTLSVHIAHLFAPQYFDVIAFGLQTLLYRWRRYLSNGAPRLFAHSAQLAARRAA